MHGWQGYVIGDGVKAAVKKLDEVAGLADDVSKRNIFLMDLYDSSLLPLPVQLDAQFETSATLYQGALNARGLDLQAPPKLDWTL